MINLDSVPNPDFASHRCTGPRPRSQQSGFLRFPPDLVFEVLLVNPGLHIVQLFEAALERVLARPVATATQAVLAVRLFANRVGASLAHPRNPTPATEAVAATSPVVMWPTTALREPTPLRFGQRVPAGTVAEG